MYILGIDCYYHDAAATLIRDGVVVAAAEEERFTRKKHDQDFPIRAIRYCLESQGIGIEAISYVGFYEKPLLKFERILSQHLEMFPKSYPMFVRSLPAWINQKLQVFRQIRKKLKYRGEVFFLEHHLAHAASAFLVSPFERAAIVTVDGVGEWTTTAWGIGEGNRIRLLNEIRFPHSLGLLYSTITAYLGFSVNNSEYKVMGLSAFGNRNRETNSCYRKLLRTIDIKEDGSYRLDLSYFVYPYGDRMPSQKLCELLGGPVLPRDAKMTEQHQNIAAALQMVTEDVMTKILRHVHRTTGLDQVVLAGGVALNSVYNGKILRETPFQKVWIQPNATDGGSSMGAAAYVYHSILGHERREYLKSAYLGPAFDDQIIRNFLDSRQIVYQALDPTEIPEVTAREIFANRVVGWFQGRMEWAPRALGARSILANPCSPDMKATLNEKVKHRERFRPFAPVVCVEDAPTYFECDLPIPEPADFMLMVYPIREHYRSQIPAVTHVDGSGRLQTVRREQHPLYYDTIKEFGRLSGIPMLVNTSFNIRGEPIVCSPADAYRCMMGTGIDCLVMGNYLIRRVDNLKDQWDSETLATD